MTATLERADMVSTMRGELCELMPVLADMIAKLIADDFQARLDALQAEVHALTEQVEALRQMGGVSDATIRKVFAEGQGDSPHLRTGVFAKAWGVGQRTARRSLVAGELRGTVKEVATGCWVLVQEQA